MGDEVDFVPADKQESFIQFDGITLSVQGQACPKYQKQVYNILAITQRKREG